MSVILRESTSHLVGVDRKLYCRPFTLGGYRGELPTLKARVLRQYDGLVWSWL